MAQDDDTRGLRQILLLAERAAEHCLTAEQFEEVGGHLRRPQLLGKRSTGEIDHAEAEGRDILDDALLSPPVLELRRRGRRLCGDVFMNSTRRSGLGNGIDLSRTVLTTEKMAVFTPIPNVKADTAASVNAGLWANIRRECLRSLSMMVIRRR
jgi:hypothetical protein